jgi:glutamine synthetase
MEAKLASEPFRTRSTDSSRRFPQQPLLQRMTMPTTSKFIERHGLYSPYQVEAAARSRKLVEQHGIDVVRLVWPDQYGLLRGKALTRAAYFGALEAGNEITMAPFFFDSANAIVLNPFTPDGGFEIDGLGGSPNVTAVPDPGTFTVLPWAPRTAAVFADLYQTNGATFPLAPRTILKQTLSRLAERNLTIVAGIEIEWYLTRVVDDLLGKGSMGGPGTPADPPVVAPVARGYNYLLVDHLDEIDDALTPIRNAITAMGLPLRTFDDEWAPSQVETTFDVLEGLAVADSVSLFKMATKQIAKRNGYLASFMCTPAIAGFCASGWHLHTSIADATTGQNLMVPEPGQALSTLGQHYVGGTLAHGRAASVFTTPTINGYHRRRPYSLAPDRLAWAKDNRAAMMRVISAPGDQASHVENRVGEAAANPYLYLAAQAAAGLDGIVNEISPGPISEDPYTEDVTHLPTTLTEAVDALATDAFYRKEFGSVFIDYLVTMKHSEISRYEAWLVENPNPETYVNGVTDWEHREYFELF